MDSEHLIPRFTERIPDFGEGVFKQVDLRAKNFRSELGATPADELGCRIVERVDLWMAIPLVAETPPKFFALLGRRGSELIKIEDAPIGDRRIRIAESAVGLVDAGEMEGRIHSREQRLAN